MTILQRQIAYQRQQEAIRNEPDVFRRAAEYWGKRVREHLANENWESAYFLTIVAGSAAEAYLEAVKR